MGEGSVFVREHDGDNWLGVITRPTQRFKIDRFRSLSHTEEDREEHHIRRGWPGSDGDPQDVEHVPQPAPDGISLPPRVRRECQLPRHAR